MSDHTSRALAVDLVAVLVAVTDGEPRVLTTREATALPAGPFEQGHRSLQAGLRAWVEQQTHHPLGYVEQLYTFADRDRIDASGAEVQAMSISYLALTREAAPDATVTGSWQNWYRYFPWEDRRAGAPPLIDARIVPALGRWVAAAPDAQSRALRDERVAVTFGLQGHGWNEDLVLQRYELMYEAGLVSEAVRRAGKPLQQAMDIVPGDAMRHDHRRILATGIARLRAKIKYRPVFFELMPSDFTLLQLQQAVEALAGRRLHKQNFRRLVEQQELVEETGEVQAGGAGRPAKLFRFRRGVLLERAIAGSKLPLARSL
ncbi:hypothetical protein FOZ76_17280 [Verticiella sediminum]|uniref:NrtR DNA-binding winged helix domain-containing protein n=1 Tax=Verticiella sediminum TaxID=1247510 RepID=A0A556AGW6_9BURK|nr:hypothetical protein [Verticiella sediminum]TSH92125.1 hypothetical protein FOZ76_17280 [Verticiella sediminum]